MRPETLPLISDFKKEYNFLWWLSIDPTEYDLSTISQFDPEVISLFQSVVINPKYAAYVSQLAEKVSIPDDSFETEELSQGPANYKLPKRVEMPDITVTYLEDSLESVYYYHKAWFQAIRCGKSKGINSPCYLSVSAKYINFNTTLTATEYALYKNQFIETLTSAISSVSLMPTLPLGTKPSSYTTYPKIYPYKISRGEADHQGEGLSKITVTYARLPVFKKKHSALQKLSTSGWWEDSSFSK